MKKFVSVVMAISLVGAAFVGPADAAKKKSRKVQGGYDMPALIVAGSCAQTGAIGCVAIATGAKEKYVTAKVNDQHGQPVYVAISIDENGDNQDDTSLGSFCGETTEPIEVPPSTELHFWVGAQADPGFAGCVPGFGTSGTVDVTLSNLP